MIKVHDKRVCAVLEFLRSAKNGCVELKFTANKAHAQRAQRGPSIQYMYNQGAFSLRSVCCPTLQGYIAPVVFVNKVLSLGHALMPFCRGTSLIKKRPLPLGPRSL